MKKIETSKLWIPTILPVFSSFCAHNDDDINN